MNIHEIAHIEYVHGQYENPVKINVYFGVFVVLIKRYISLHIAGYILINFQLWYRPDIKASFYFNLFPNPTAWSGFRHIQYFTWIIQMV